MPPFRTSKPRKRKISSNSSASSKDQNEAANSDEPDFKTRMWLSWNQMINAPTPFLKILNANIFVPTMALSIAFDKESFSIDVILGSLGLLIATALTVYRMAKFRKPGSSYLQLSHMPWQFAPCLLSIFTKSIIFSLVLILISLVLVVLMPPIVRLPPPRGPYRVSTLDTVIQLRPVDSSTPSKKKKNDDSKPALLSKKVGSTLQHARIFYPTSTTEEQSSEPTRYFAQSIPQLKGLAHFVKTPVLLFAYLKNGIETSTIENGEPLDWPNNRPKRPLIIFQHGLGGWRAAYSSLCADWASFGSVVICLESQDGTAVATSQRGLNPAEGVAFYTVPTKEQLDTGSAMLMRRHQIAERLSDIDSLLDTLHNSYAGDNDNQDWKRLVKKIADISRVHLAGHSFGGCSVTEMSVRGLQRKNNVKLMSCLSLDGWIEPMSEDSLNNGKLLCPTLFINSDSFQWDKNVSLMKSLIERCGTRCAVATIEKTGHQDVSDFAAFMPNLLYFRKSAGPLNPFEAVYAFSDASAALFGETESRFNMKKSTLKDEQLQELRSKEPQYFRDIYQPGHTLADRLNGVKHLRVDAITSK